MRYQLVSEWIFGSKRVPISRNMRSINSSTIKSGSKRRWRIRISFRSSRVVWLLLVREEKARSERLDRRRWSPEYADVSQAHAMHLSNLMETHASKHLRSKPISRSIPPSVSPSRQSPHVLHPLASKPPSHPLLPHDSTPSRCLPRRNGTGQVGPFPHVD